MVFLSLIAKKLKKFCFRKKKVWLDGLQCLPELLVESIPVGTALLHPLTFVAAEAVEQLFGKFLQANKMDL
jgi:hypothetical protein